MTTTTTKRDQREELHPLSKLERSQIIDALRFARSEPGNLRPMLNLAEAATLDTFRRLRLADADAAPTVSRLAEYLGWTRSQTIEQLEALRRKGFIKRAPDCSLYVETIEAVALKCSAPLVALALALATIDPANPEEYRRARSIHHANAVEVCRRIAQLVPSGKVRANTNAGEAAYYGPRIPVLRWHPRSNGWNNSNTPQNPPRTQQIAPAMTGASKP